MAGCADGPSLPPLQLVAFDLDGTILDSLDDIARSLNRLRHELGLPDRSRGEVRRAIGAGARVLLARTMGDQDRPPEDLYPEFLRHYREESVRAPRLFPGTREFLTELGDRGTTLAVLTNKPLEITEAVLEALDLSARFEAVLAPENAGGRKPDPVGLFLLLRQFGVPAARAALVGDSVNDFAAARAAGVFAIGVRCGYHTEAGQEPDRWFDDIAGLRAACARPA